MVHFAVNNPFGLLLFSRGLEKLENRDKHELEKRQISYFTFMNFNLFFIIRNSAQNSLKSHKFFYFCLAASRFLNKFSMPIIACETCRSVFECADKQKTSQPGKKFECFTKENMFWRRSDTLEMRYFGAERQKRIP
jgi:hypothetical protein